MQRLVLAGLRAGGLRAGRASIVVEAGLGLPRPSPAGGEQQLPALLASADRGLLLATDLARAAQAVRGEEELAGFRHLLLKYVEMNRSDSLILFNAQSHLLSYYQLCHELGSAPAALALWRDEAARPLHTSGPTVVLLNLLFKEGLWREVVEVQAALAPNGGRGRTDQLALTLALLALCRLGPDAGYPEARLLVDEFLARPGPPDPGGVTGRAAYAYSWLALRSGHPAAAHSALQGRPARRSLGLNLEVAALVELGRPEEAIDCLEALAGARDGPERPGSTRPQLAREVVRGVVEAAAGGPDHLNQRLRDIFGRLDSCAEITDKTILDLLLLPIVWNQPIVRRSTPLDSLKRRYRQGAPDMSTGS